MPYKRRQYRARGRRYRKRGSRFSKLVTGKSNLSRAERLLSAGAPYAKAVPAIANTVGRVLSMINTEDKYNDQTQSNQSVPNTGFVSSVLTVMARGTADNERIGNKVLGKDILIRGSVAINSASTVTQNVRLMLVCDKEYDGATAALTDVLQSVDPFSPIEEHFTKRFTILRSYNFALSSQRPNVTFKIYSKVPWHVWYDGSGSTSTDGKENQLYLMAVSDLSTNVPVLTYYSRFKFYDN